MESLVGNRLYEDVMHLNNNKICTLTPELQLSPFLTRLLLQENNTLTWLPKFFFRNMPVLLVLNLSHTSIPSLPPSISKLCSLEEFILRDCSLLIELPHEIGALKNLKLFDLEGTEVMYLPKEIGKLGSLERLRVSLSTYADDYKDRHVIQHIIPRKTILKLTKLKELSISVSPEAEWWEVELLEAVMRDLLFLPDLKTLKLYLPTAKSLQQFLRLERYKVPIYSSLWNYRFMTGRCEELPLSVHLDTEENFLKLEKCVKYMNGEGNNDEMVELISDARALYLRRHWTVEKLSMFDISKLKYCLLMECNEMRTLVDQDDFCKDRNKSTSRSEEEELLGSLQYLSIHFLKKLQSISKGLIGRNSLSCLRILALHTCPELTSIFTECLLDNLQSLTEIIVEDCPKVNCLIKLEEGEHWRYGPFLPNLRRVSLLDLPELVSVSGGVCIAPQLDTLLVFNCMKLAYLSVMEIPRDTRSIKGEIEWWDALKYGKLTWESVFVQLKRDGSLMDQLAEDTNSLQHFLELEMLPSLPGQVNRKSSRDTKEDSENVDQFQIVHNVDLSNETQKMSTLKILNCNNGTQSHYARTAFRMWEPPSPMSVKPDNKDTNCNLKAPSHKLPSTKKLSRSADIAKWIRQVKENPNDARKYLQNKSFRSKYKSSNSTVTSTHRVKVNKGVEDEKALDDGYMWRKYSEKFRLGSKFPRAYYRCCFGSRYGCSANKQVQRSDDDPSVFKVTYRGKHTCPIDLSNSFSSTATESACTTLTLRGSSTATESASRITESHFELAKRPRVLDSNKSKSVSSMDAKRIQLLKVSPNTGFDTPPDDGYIWRKHGQPDKIRATYPKLYYRCNSCDAKKLVQRSDDDPSFWIVTYEGYHTCPCLSASDFSCESKSTTSILKSSKSPTTIESELRNLKSSGSSTAVESTSSATDNSSGQNYAKKLSGSASIQRCKQQAEEIQSPLQFQIPSSYEPNMIISKVQENDSRNISSSAKTPLNAKQCPLPDLKVRKEKLGDRITELQQLVSPFGKTDTASVLEETCDYIKFLHEQVKVLLTSYVKQETPLEPKQQALKQDLRNKGLCLVPSQAHFHLLIKQEPNAYKTALFPYSGML